MNKFDDWIKRASFNFDSIILIKFIFCTFDCLNLEDVTILLKMFFNELFDRIPSSLSEETGRSAEK